MSRAARGLILVGVLCGLGCIVVGIYTVAQANAVSPLHTTITAGLSLALLVLTGTALIGFLVLAGVVETADRALAVTSPSTAPADLSDLR